MPPSRRAGSCSCLGWKWRLRNWWSVCWLRWWYVVRCDWRCGIFLFWSFLCLSVWCLKWPVRRLCKVQCWCWVLAVGKGGNFPLARMFRHRRNCPLYVYIYIYIYIYIYMFSLYLYNIYKISSPTFKFLISTKCLSNNQSLRVLRYMFLVGYDIQNEYSKWDRWLKSEKNWVAELHRDHF